MKKIGLILGIVFLAAAFSLSAVLLAEISAPDSKTGISLYENGDTVADVFQISDLVPGERISKQYRVNCGNGISQLVLTFQAGEEQGLLRFLNASVIKDGESLYSGSLSALVGEKLKTSVEGSAEITVEYSMPLETGNEAQGEKIELNLLFGLNG